MVTELSNNLMPSAEQQIADARNSERKQAEKALKDSEERFRNVATLMPAAAYVIDRSGVIQWYNRRAVELWGREPQCDDTQESLYGSFRIYLLDGTPVPHSEAPIAVSLRTGVPVRAQEEVLERSDGSRVRVLVNVAPIKDEQQEVTGAIICFEDITERKESEQRLREQAALLDQAHDAILVRDMDDHIRFWNKGAERLYGWKAEEVLGRKMFEILYLPGRSNEFEDVQKVVLERGEWSGELFQQTRDGQEIVVESRWTLMYDDQGRPKGKLIIHTDVTEKKRLAAQFLRAQRLESIGVLAAGIAHDFNNILTPMTMGVRLLKKDRSKEEQSRLLDTLEASIERAGELVRQILAFAGGTEGNQMPMSLALVICEVRELLQHTLMPSISLRVNVGTELWPVTGDNTLLSQVLMNLCVNARDAMQNGGDLVIEAENIILDDAFAQTHPEAKAGPYVRVAVEDTGTGIPLHLHDKIFDPFFSTKGPGKGTGLGLATVLGIIKRHNGFITVYSEVDKGTRFTIYLPALSPFETRQAKRDLPALANGSGETILVVDDEPSILLTVQATLKDHGYRVLTAPNGVAALAAYRQHGGEIRAVLLDMMMPGMDGPTLMQSIRNIDPDVRILASSGLQVAARKAELMAAGARVLLQKPFLLQKPYSDEQLLAAIKDVCRS